LQNSNNKTGFSFIIGSDGSKADASLIVWMHFYPSEEFARQKCITSA